MQSMQDKGPQWECPGGLTNQLGGAGLTLPHAWSCPELLSRGQDCLDARRGCAHAQLWVNLCLHTSDRVSQGVHLC